MRIFFTTLLVSFSVLVLAQSRVDCPNDIITYNFEKASGIDTLILDPFITSAVYQYFDAPQDIVVNGARFFGWKTDPAAPNFNVKVELRYASNDSIPLGALLASGTVQVTHPDSLNGPLGAYMYQVTWPAVTVDKPYTVVVRNEATNDSLTLLHSSLLSGDGGGEWLGGVFQGAGWVRSYFFQPSSIPFDADFFIEPFVDYNLNASFSNDPECLFNELGDTVQFYNEGSSIVDNKFYNRYAFYNLPNRQEWNFGDGSPVLVQPNPAHFYPTNGPFAATLKASILSWSNQECISTATQIIKERPNQDFSHSNNNLEVTFKNESVGIFNNVSYDFGDGNSSLSENPKHKYARPGTYWVCQSMSTSCGVVKVCKNVAVVTNTALNCGKDSVRYTTARATKVRTLAMKNIGSPKLYGLGQIFDAPQPMIVHGFTFYANHEGLFRDSYPVTCRIYKRGSNSLPEGAPLAVSTVRINKYDVDTNYSDTTRYTAIFNKPVNIKVPYILTIEYDSSTIVRIGTSDWSENDGDADLKAIGKINDTTWVTAASVAVFNAGGAPFDADVIIEPLIEYNLNANFEYNTECVNPPQVVTFFNESSEIVRNKMYNQIVYNTSSILAFEWDFDDGSAISNQITATHQFTTSGPFDVTLTIKMEGWTNYCESKQTLNLPVPPTGGFSFSQIENTVTFNDSSVNADTVLWTFSDGTVSILREPIHFYTTTGSFEVCQYVSNVCGSDTTCDTVQVNVVGLPESLSAPFKIFPNPAKDELTIQGDFGNSSVTRITIMDLRGRVVRERSFTESVVNETLYVGDLSTGSYIMYVRTDGWESKSKFMISR